VYCGSEYWFAIECVTAVFTGLVMWTLGQCLLVWYYVVWFIDYLFHIEFWGSDY